MFTSISYGNADAAVINILRKLNLKVNPAIISAELERHPDYPSLLAVSDVLTSLNIENSVYRLPFDELKNIPCPYIAYTNSNGGELVVVDKISDDKISISNQKRKNHKIKIETFEKKYVGVFLTAELLLWLEFIPLLTKAIWTGFSFKPTWSDASVLFICLLLPVILWTILKSLLLSLQQLNPLKQQLRTFKYNAELFNIQLKAQPKYALPDEEWSIALGNLEANNVIIMVTNPYCPPCTKTHKILDELLSQNVDIRARIIFTANNSDTDIKTPVSRHMMALSDLPDKTIIRKAIYDWYEQKKKSYEVWAKAYPVEIKETAFYKIDKQKEWCNLAEVTATPTLLLNGYRLPEFYQLPDLKYMMQ